MNKIFKKLFLIIITMLMFCFIKQSNIYGIGLVYQAWAEDGNSYLFRTFTAPLPETVKNYNNKYNKTSSILKTDVSPNGKFTYTYFDNSNKKQTLVGRSYWVMGSDNSYLQVNNPTFGAFATRKIIFHKTSLVSKYGISSKDEPKQTFKYSTLINNTIIGDKLNNVPNIYGDTITGGSTSENGIIIHSSPENVCTLGTVDAENTLYRMTILAPGSNSNAIYVADRKLSATQINSIKGSNDDHLSTIQGHSRAIYVSQLLGFAATAKDQTNKKWTIAENPQEFIAKYKGSWGDGTRGYGTKALGSAFNLYDNILIFPVEASRYLTVRQVELKDHATNNPTTKLSENTHSIVETDPDAVLQNGEITKSKQDSRRTIFGI